MIKPYYEHGGIAIYHGDCKEILPTLGKFDLLLTDPPYGMNWKFSGGGTGKNAQGGRFTKFQNMTIAGDKEEFDPSFLMNHNTVILWGMQHFPQHLHRGSVFVWQKKYEDALGTFLSDGDLAWMNKGCGVYISRVINPASFQKDRAHPTQKPVELMVWCIQKSGEIGAICDPYMGSGTTLVAAKQLGRRCVGIELEEKYCEVAAKRLQQSVMDFEEVVPARPVATAQAPLDF